MCIVKNSKMKMVLGVELHKTILILEFLTMHIEYEPFVAHPIHFCNCTLHSFSCCIDENILTAFLHLISNID